MKNSILCILAILTLSFSCDKDDESCNDLNDVLGITFQTSPIPEMDSFDVNAAGFALRFNDDGTFISEQVWIQDGVEMRQGFSSFDRWRYNEGKFEVNGTNSLGVEYGWDDNSLTEPEIIDCMTMAFATRTLVRQ